MTDTYAKKISDCAWYALPKDSITSPEHIKAIFGEGIGYQDNKKDHWLIQSTTQLYPSATEEMVAQVENTYQVQLPTDYKHFLLETNGADLFIHPQAYGMPFFSPCQLLSTQKLLNFNRDIWEVYRTFSFVGEALPVQSEWGYLPIAHVGDAHYIAMSTHPDYPNEMFYLYDDGGYMPYDHKTRKVDYRSIYPATFDEWLMNVLDSYGAIGLHF